MTKIAIMGTIHSDGLIFLKNQGYNILEIVDFSEEKLKSNLKDVDGIVLRTAKLSKDVLQNCKKSPFNSRIGCIS